MKLNKKELRAIYDSLKFAAFPFLSMKEKDSLINKIIDEYRVQKNN